MANHHQAESSNTNPFWNEETKEEHGGDQTPLVEESERNTPEIHTTL